MIRQTLSAAAVAFTAVLAPMKWTAHMTPMNGSKIEGTATVVPDGNGKMTVTITIAGGEKGQTYPWHVHTGKCSTGGGVYGPGSAYTPITLDPYGAGKVTVTVPVAAPESGDYHVNVHKSASDMATIVSCGDLTMQM
jgi:hypothetical protein